MLQRYICYNDLYCEGELSNFISILYKAFTYNLNSLYLTEGNEYSFVNELIRFIFRTIGENFQIKEYYHKKQINELYDLIANSIQNCSDMTIEQNYAKFVIEYCRFFNQGNKNIVKVFLGGLNKNNFINVFKEIPIDNNENFYSNIDKYMNEIKTKTIKKDIKGKSNKSKITNEKYQKSLLPFI